MPFDPLSIVGYVGTAAGLLSFIAGTIENVDKRVRDYRGCATRILQLHHCVEISFEYYRGWTRLWCEGDRPYSEDTYIYFWGEDGLYKVCQRLDVVRQCFSEVSDILSNGPKHDPELKMPDLNQWYDVAATVKRGENIDYNDFSPDWSYKICFALYKNAALKTAVDALEKAVNQLCAYSVAVFWVLQEEANLKKEVNESLVRRLNDLRGRVEEWSEFMSDLHRLNTTAVETQWALALRLPDAQGCPECLITDSDIEINFIISRKVLNEHLWADVIVIRYPTDYGVCNSASPFAEQIPESYEVGISYPNTRATAFRCILNEISRCVINTQRERQLATRLERAEAALGLANWVILLWNTPWIPEICTCAIYSTIHSDNKCHFTLHWKETNHVQPQCVIESFGARRYLHLGIALAEFAIGLPITLNDTSQLDDLFCLDTEPRSLVDLLREVGRKTSHGYRCAVEYCFKMDEKSLTKVFRPENMERDNDNILKPVREYYDSVIKHQQTQQNRSWLHEVLSERRNLNQRRLRRMGN